jgi:Protein of unknown function (DUF3147)
MIRFVVGGFVVSAFSLISDLLKPKTFAGLFGAVPSVALASLALTVFKMGKHTAAIEARSMLIGGVAFPYLCAHGKLQSCCGLGLRPCQHLSHCLSCGLR